MAAGLELIGPAVGTDGHAVEDSALGERGVHPDGGQMTQSVARERSWRETLSSHGIEAPTVFRGDWSPRSGYEAGRALVAELGVTAVFLANDQMALGMLRAFAEAGLAIPRDVHVVGFDDVPEAAYFSPPLTAVRQDFTEVGRQAFELLLARLGDEDSPHRHLITPEPVVRESTGLR